ncbi:putative lipid phosphatase [Martiniozyma asiatica (nom. inval.)]|nr:putative lipid phosphatase [Martiniozyma asiatica]
MLLPKQRIKGNTKTFVDGPEKFKMDVKSTKRFGIRFKQLMTMLLSFWMVVHYFERVKPYNALKSCTWNNWENWGSDSDPHHAIVYGDPQIVDDYSYPNYPFLLLAFTKILSDNYLHRNHVMIKKVLDPHSIFFVGDLFDGGREWDDSLWFKEFERFNSIFSPLDGVRQFRQIPGNHDIGFGQGINFEKYSRFRSYFGNADEVLLLGNHSIVLMDSVSLSCDNDKRISYNSQKFLESLQDPHHIAHAYPSVLLTHVPLYRLTEIQTCGSYRESKKPFPVMKGKQYQTVLDYEISQKFINWIKPSLILSGDDHDYCHVRHPFDKYMQLDKSDYEISEDYIPGIHYADEITLKSSAMTGGIKRPGIQLMSFWNPENFENEKWKTQKKESKTVDAKTVKAELCYLPDPYEAIRAYSFCLIMSILWLIVCILTPSVGHRLNHKFIIFFERSKSVIIRAIKNPEVSINLGSMEPKKSSLLERFSKWILDWDVESHRDWKMFIINTSVYVISAFMIVIFYFNSI